MAAQSVEVVTRVIGAFNRGELDRALADVHSDVEWEPVGVLPDSDIYRGHDGVRRFWEMWRESFGDFALEIDECADAGDGVVLVIARATGHGRGSGIGAESPRFGQVIEVSDGKIVRNRMYSRVDAARDAAGLREGRRS